MTTAQFVALPDGFYRGWVCMCVKCRMWIAPLGVLTVAMTKEVADTCQRGLDASGARCGCGEKARMVYVRFKMERCLVMDGIPRRKPDQEDRPL